MSTAPVDISDLLRPELTELNRVPARPPLEPFPNREAARSNQGSSWRRSLDGVWRFALVNRPCDAPARWMLPTTSDTNWRTIDVPGVWTRQDTGDLPHYTNIVMPWSELDPPQTPDRNPTGLHRTTFRVPKAWIRRQVIVHIGAAESVTIVWCNGTFVGMGKDSRLPSEFDLTPHLGAGENLLAVMVVRYSDATWIEDQDHWWHAGIHRSCHLEARGRNRIDDLRIVADFDATARQGHLEVTAAVTGEAPCSIRVRCETARGRQVGPELTAEPDRFTRGGGLDQVISAMTYRGPVAEVRSAHLAVEPWSAEAPTRYRVVTELLGAHGDVLEAHTTWTGFRRVEVKDRRLLINDRPIVVHGVNRHDHHPINGKTCSVDDLRADLVMMKRHNINAVRTAHYPNDHRLLDLCDELGLYVIDEANVESHARWASLTQDPRYFTAVVERSRRMVLRDRNHPCVIGWSLGNESGHGPCHDAAAAWIRAVDPTRFIHYEGAIFGLIGPARSAVNAAPTPSQRLVTDLMCPMYSPVADIVAWARWAETTKLDDRPLILCEFSHAMGNSNGSITDYVDAFHREPALGGGFVWDWRDQGLAATAENGRNYWAYGGDFGDEPNDGSFCGNGLVDPDGHPHPGLREYMWACRPVVAEHLGGRRVRLTNRRHFASTADLVLWWTITVNGDDHATGSVIVDLEPGASRTITLPAETAKLPTGEAHLLLQWRYRRQTRWCDRGHEVAWDQFALTTTALTSRAFTPRASTPRASTPRAGASAPQIEIGELGIEGVALEGRPLVCGDIVACLSRAPIDNEGAAHGWMAEIANHRNRWAELGLADIDSVVERIDRRRRDGCETITLHRRVVGAHHEAGHRTRITIAADHLRFDERIDLPDEWRDIARVGVRFETVAALGRLTWFGRGPQETYPDRFASSPLRVWRQTVAEQYHDYLVPQEHGSHIDTRWFELSDHRGRKVRVDAVDTPLIFAARRHHDAALAVAQTAAELEMADTIEVHVDSAQRGVGTGICGPDTLRPHRLKAGVHAWSWILSG